MEESDQNSEEGNAYNINVDSKVQAQEFPVGREGSTGSYTEYILHYERWTFGDMGDNVMV